MLSERGVKTLSAVHWTVFEKRNTMLKIIKERLYE